MFFRKRKREVPGLNTSSTADISFMLLILFLVTTSIDSNKGVYRQLPAIEKKTKQEAATTISAGHLLQIEVKKDGVVLLDKKQTDVAAIEKRVEQLVKINGKQHFIQLKTDRDASYNTYFQVQNAIVTAYKVIKNRESLAMFGRIYDLCSAEQQAAIDDKVPERLSEVYILASNGNKSEGED